MFLTPLDMFSTFKKCKRLRKKFDEFRSIAKRLGFPYERFYVVRPNFIDPIMTDEEVLDSLTGLAKVLMAYGVDPKDRQAIAQLCNDGLLIKSKKDAFEVADKIIREHEGTVVSIVRRPEREGRHYMQDHLGIKKESSVGEALPKNIVARWKFDKPFYLPFPYQRMALPTDVKPYEFVKDGKRAFIQVRNPETGRKTSTLLDSTGRRPMTDAQYKELENALNAAFCKGGEKYRHLFM